ncbi:TatD family hydrolase [Aquabacterium sp. A08]|nr:TatD family hydrolase [Aquabacterium sp. A08]
MWIDTHCHLDAPEWTDTERLRARDDARRAGVALCVYPAVARPHWDAVRALAHRTGDAYALGIHPLCVPQATDDDLAALDAALSRHRDDPRLVAVGEIGLDFFVPALCEPALRERQTLFYTAQLRLAQRHGLPVLLHVRRSADALLHGLRNLARQGRPVAGGLAHAFNGSAVQAQAFLGLGLALGFGGAVTFDTARQLQRLAASLPLDALALETDAPDIPPQWLYVPAAERARGRPQGRNAPAELPRIGAMVARLRGLDVPVLAQATTANALRVLPRLRALWPAGRSEA